LLALFGNIHQDTNRAEGAAMRTTIPSGSIAGVALGTHWSTLLAILSFILSIALFPLNSIETVDNQGAQWLLALGVGIGLYGSLVLHELGHAITAHGMGLSPNSAVLYPFGAISNIQERAASPIHEGLLAAAGPMVNVGLGMLLAIGGALLEGSTPIGAIGLEFLGVANLTVALVNLYPGLPLDGGRLLRALVWFINGERDRGTRWALASGLVAPFLLMAGGVAIGLVYPALGLWVFLDGLFIGFVCGKRYQKVVAEEEQRAEH
jgi:Zn-dependent protease